MARDMMLTVEEYMALRRLIESERESEGSSLEQKPKRRRRDPKLKKALREANSRLRNKNGSLKKGKTQGDVMRLAHKLKKKM
tara:strand:+ start:37 stop:282 length:246 start_codon:yes stop_codon:yes gene_type:complete